MECDICYRGHHPQRLPFICAVDARNQAYEGRLKNLQILLENETLRSQIGGLIADKGKPGTDALEAARADQARAQDKTAQILEAADRLRDDIKAARDEIRARKADLARRKADLATVSDGLADRRTRQLNDVQRSTQMLRYRWSQSAEEMAGTRAFLCAEAADLYGLRRVASKIKKNAAEYYLGRVPIIDLMSLNSASAEAITTSLAHVSHILFLASHYLAVRLPAEVTLPHRDYPHPTIFNVPNSYRHGETTASGASTPTPSQPSTPGAPYSPRPRPLYIHKTLPQLLKDDPAAYSLFLEGVSLLAYDIAWLCSSQGILISDKAPFEDICHMGKNLYSLLVEHPVSSKNAHPSATTSGGPAAQNGDQDEATTRNWVGRYSHGTTFYFLGGSDGSELVRAFKLPNPTKLADKLRKKLIGDAPVPDWEVLDDDAWKEEDVPTEDIQSHSHSVRGSVTSTSTTVSQRNGSSDWTMVK